MELASWPFSVKDFTAVSRRLETTPCKTSYTNITTPNLAPQEHPVYSKMSLTWVSSLRRRVLNVSKLPHIKDRRLRWGREI